MEEEKVPQILLICKKKTIEEELDNIKNCINEGYFSIWENTDTMDISLIPNILYFSKNRNSILIEFLLEGSIFKFWKDIIKIIENHLKNKDTKIYNNFSNFKKINIKDFEEVSPYPYEEERERGFSM